MGLEHKMWVEPKPKTAGIAGIEGIKGTVKDEAKNQKNIRKFWAGFYQKADEEALLR